MRAFLISHSNGGGGAGRATQRLFDALDSTGMQLGMYADFKHGDDPRIVGGVAWRRRARIVAEEIPGWLTRHPQRDLLFPGLTSAVRGAQIRPAQWDVANVHWTGYGTLSIREFARLGVPVVWTLHDMWAIGGGLAYDSDAPDAAWRLGFPPGSATALERWVFRRKTHAWTVPWTVVSPSRWLAGLVADSPLGTDWAMRVIPNPLDVTAYAPGDTATARAELGLPADTALVGVAIGGAADDPRKGLDLLDAAAQRIVAARPDAQLVVLGAEQAPTGWRGRMRAHWLGRLDDARMVQGYRACDVVVVPSRQDNLPQTATEAQSCGTPVVAFDIGGLPDALEDGVTGLLALPFDPTALATHVVTLLDDHAMRAAMGAAARARAVERWSPSVVASAYLDAFEAARASHRLS